MTPIITMTALGALALIVAMLSIRAVQFAVEQAICHVQQTFVTPLRSRGNGPLTDDQAGEALDRAIDSALLLLGDGNQAILRVLLCRRNLRPWLAIRIEANLYQLKETELVATSRAGWQARNPAVGVVLETAQEWLTNVMLAANQSSSCQPQPMPAPNVAKGPNACAG